MQSKPCFLSFVISEDCKVYWITFHFYNFQGFQVAPALINIRETKLDKKTILFRVIQQQQTILFRSDFATHRLYLLGHKERLI